MRYVPQAESATFTVISGGYADVLRQQFSGSGNWRELNSENRTFTVISKWYP
ncbi:hypothetical protein JOJ88_005038 [Pantoea cypripedii]|nr:hypothetical protein [Pantoea cypripedii]